MHLLASYQSVAWLEMAENKQVQRRWAYAEAGWSRIASLAPAVLQCAEEGDSVAFKIVTSAAHEALEAVMTVATKTKLRGQRFRLVLSGARIPHTWGGQND